METRSQSGFLSLDSSVRFAASGAEIRGYPQDRPQLPGPRSLELGAPPLDEEMRELLSARGERVELRLRVRASSVNPVDLAVVAGRLTTMADYEFPVVLGRDFAGSVEQIGPGVTAFETGDEVYGFLPSVNPTVHAGSWAERISLRRRESRSSSVAIAIGECPRQPQKTAASL